MITITSLTKSYGRHQVLKGINLVFRRGEVNGIAGENGAGKTTFFKCLAHLETYEGKIEYDKGILKDHTGFLPTDPYFFTKMTGEEYLQLMVNARNIQVSSFKENNLFDLPLHEYAENYSTGMKKKLALTGLLLQKNDVFILDEPFNGVDIHSNIIIREILLKLKQLNKIVIMSSHIFSTLNESCDHLHHLKEGVIKQTAERGEFERIEEEMRGEGIGNKIEGLML